MHQRILTQRASGGLQCNQRSGHPYQQHTSQPMDGKQSWTRALSVSNFKRSSFSPTRSSLKSKLSKMRRLVLIVRCEVSFAHVPPFKIKQLNNRRTHRGKLKWKLLRSRHWSWCWNLAWSRPLMGANWFVGWSTLVAFKDKCQVLFFFHKSSKMHSFGSLKLHMHQEPPILVQGRKSCYHHGPRLPLHKHASIHDQRMIMKVTLRRQF